MQVAINPTLRATLKMVTNPKGRIGWFAGKAGIGRNTVAKLRKESEQFADQEVIDKVQAALKLDEVRQLIKELKQVAA